MSFPTAKNLTGDRDIEWGWVFAHLPAGPGIALDFGPGRSFVALVLAMRGYDVTTIDLEPPDRAYVHPRVRHLGGDLLLTELPGGYDLVVNCSTVEHVGLAGRYGVTEAHSDGDLEAMARLHGLMKPGGRMLLTVPAGRDAVFAPMCRVYGRERLPQLLDGFAIEREAYWVKDDNNRWTDAHRDAALDYPASAGDPDPLRNCYALAGFVLRR
jgi:SAM-dependent methyltransferase